MLHDRNESLIGRVAWSGPPLLIFQNEVIIFFLKNQKSDYQGKIFRSGPNNSPYNFKIFLPIEEKIRKTTLLIIIQGVRIRTACDDSDRVCGPDHATLPHLVDQLYQWCVTNEFVLYKLYKGLQFPKPLVFSVPSVFPLLLGLAAALHPAAKRLVSTEHIIIR